MYVVSAQRLGRLVQGGIIALVAAFLANPSAAAPAQQTIGSKAGIESQSFRNLNQPSSIGRQLTPSRHRARNYGHLPLSFEANQGQAPQPVQFVSRGKGYTLSLAADKA